MISLSTPVTGGTQTGLTSPTYTVGADTPPNASSKQWAVTALGGTQTGVTVHSASSPFTVTFFRPPSYKALGSPNPSTGVVASVPRNVYKIVVRKGAIPASFQPPAVAICRANIEVPAGTDVYSSAELRAMISLLVGSLNQLSAGLGDTIVNGML